MIKIENCEIYGLEPAIRGMRNPMNSWDKSDSGWTVIEDEPYVDPEGQVDPVVRFVIGENDLELMRKLADAGSVHAKYRRMIVVTMDITAPLYWWKEFDTYKVGTVRNSCSTMHKIHSKPFAPDDFSYEHLIGPLADLDDMCYDEVFGELWSANDVLMVTINMLNFYRQKYLETNDKKYWWQLIQLLPSSYNQRATVMLNYEVLANIYRWRKDHKQDEWREFCSWCRDNLKYSELFTGEEDEI